MKKTQKGMQVELKMGLIAAFLAAVGMATANSIGGTTYRGSLLPDMPMGDEASYNSMMMNATATDPTSMDTYSYSSSDAAADMMMNAPATDPGNIYNYSYSSQGTTDDGMMNSAATAPESLYNYGYSSAGSSDAIADVPDTISSSSSSEDEDIVVKTKTVSCAPYQAIISQISGSYSSEATKAKVKEIIKTQLGKAIVGDFTLSAFRTRSGLTVYNVKQGGNIVWQLELDMDTKKIYSCMLKEGSAVSEDFSSSDAAL